MITIRLRENGPIVIDGDEATVIDWNGVSYEIVRRPIALCRCGGSAKKPFCDGTHKSNGFCGSQTAAPTAPPVLPPAPDDQQQG
jgi:CDGSH-type Zn-finger protein